MAVACVAEGAELNPYCHMVQIATSSLVRAIVERFTQTSGYVIDSQQTS
jgi:hypothetical protein